MAQKLEVILADSSGLANPDEVTAHSLILQW